jgi:hypothetical protein
MGALRKKPGKIAKPGEPKRKVCPYLLGQSSAGEVNVLYSQYEGYCSRIKCKLALQSYFR